MRLAMTPLICVGTFALFSARGSSAVSGERRLSDAFSRGVKWLQSMADDTNDVQEAGSDRGRGMEGAVRASTRPCSTTRWHSRPNGFRSRQARRQLPHTPTDSTFRQSRRIRSNARCEGLLLALPIFRIWGASISTQSHPHRADRLLGAGHSRSDPRGCRFSRLSGRACTGLEPRPGYSTRRLPASGGAEGCRRRWISSSGAIHPRRCPRSTHCSCCPSSSRDRRTPTTATS